ncbi:ER membrane protein complex subunit 4 [Hydra vulgaris]|uniref:ER membrane protein complex subunit 4 n=1 Tax=Hydra vulgaris TaxID=6087 RepID=A0ABM4BHB6_HYDVU
MTTRHVIKKNKWSIDFNSPSRTGVISKVKNYDHLNPVGYTDQKINASGATQVSDSKLISKRSWNIATGPAKQIPMNLFIMYMGGSSISIFPIMILGMMIFRPIKAMMAYKTTFKMFEEDKQAILLKIAWFLGNLSGIVIALWRCHSMGLLPTSPSDWLAFKEHRKQLEYVIGGMNP